MIYWFHFPARKIINWIFDSVGLFDDNIYILFVGSPVYIHITSPFSSDTAYRFVLKSDFSSKIISAPLVTSSSTSTAWTTSHVVLEFSSWEGGCSFIPALSIISHKVFPFASHFLVFLEGGPLHSGSKFWLLSYTFGPCLLAPSVKWQLQTLDCLMGSLSFLLFIYEYKEIFKCSYYSGKKRKCSTEGWNETSGWVLIIRTHVEL